MHAGGCFDQRIRSSQAYTSRTAWHILFPHAATFLRDRLHAAVFLAPRLQVLQLFEYYSQQLHVQAALGTALEQGGMMAFVALEHLGPRKCQ